MQLNHEISDFDFNFAQSLKNQRNGLLNQLCMFYGQIDSTHYQNQIFPLNLVAGFFRIFELGPQSVFQFNKNFRKVVSDVSLLCMLVSINAFLQWSSSDSLYFQKFWICQIPSAVLLF